MANPGNLPSEHMSSSPTNAAAATLLDLAHMRPADLLFKVGSARRRLVARDDPSKKAKLDEAYEIEQAHAAGSDGASPRVRLDGGATEVQIERVVPRIFADTPSVQPKILKDDAEIDHYYVKHDLLGAGVTAQAFEVTEVKDPTKRLAMKVQLRKVEAVASVDTLRMYKELLVLNKILPKHPNIYEVKDILISPQKVYILTELLEKHITLGHFFKVAGNESGRRVFKQLAEGIRFMHQYGVMHLDLLPQNILFADPNFMHLKIIDFGFCSYSPELAEIKVEGFEAEKWFETEELQKFRPKPDLDVNSLGKILLSIMAGLSVRSILAAGGTVYVMKKYIARIGLFPKSAHDMLTLIAPHPWGNREDRGGKFPSIHEVCQHPWVTGEEVDSDTSTGTGGMSSGDEFDTATNSGQIRSGDPPHRSNASQTSSFKARNSKS